jgi:homoserine kinase
MPLKQVVVRTPATSANLGPGFDVFGLALNHPSDKVTITAIAEGIEIRIKGLLANTISVDPEKNTAGIVAMKMISDFGLQTGLLIEIEKGIMPGRGLGSSAASAAAVAYGLNQMFNLGLKNLELISYAAKGEIASAGFEHADNVSAAICGQFVIVESYHPLQIVNLECPNKMGICVAMPKLAAPAHKTEKARLMVPTMVPMAELVENLGRAAVMASGFAKGDIDLIGRSMIDRIVEPARIPLIPGCLQVKENALKAGACGVTISGAGPSMMAIVNREKADARKVARAMQEGFNSVGLESTCYVTKAGKGTCLLAKK